jgi:hypothetical protein
MFDFIHQLTFWVPLSMVVWALIWYVLKPFGLDTGTAFGGRNPSTWPFTLVLATGAFFGLIAGVHEFAQGKDSWSRMPILAVAGVVSLKLVPRLWVRLFPCASASNHRGDE